jgi:hypothetical protein
MLNNIGSKITVLVIVLNCLLCLFTFSQSNSSFNVNLLIDYTSAEQTIALCEDKLIDTKSLADLRGNRIAASTASLIANNESISYRLEDYLDSLKYHQLIKQDLFHIEESRKNINRIRALLTETKKRNFGRRVVTTVEQIFPQDAAITINIPVYFVALGHQNVDAYVRRVVWHNDIPQFVGNDEGELTIVVNLARSVNYSNDLDEAYISMLCVVAHEVFHAAFGAYKSRSANWKQYYNQHKSPFDDLIDLVQNEGIAYYLSLEQRGHGYLPYDWQNKTREVFRVFNRNAREILSENISPERISQLIKNANLSGYWESYGSIAGMFMAREIDNHFGRIALIETISLGPQDFLKKYVQITKEDSNLPKLHEKVTAEIFRK